MTRLGWPLIPLTVLAGVVCAWLITDPHAGPMHTTAAVILGLVVTTALVAWIETIKKERAR